MSKKNWVYPPLTINERHPVKKQTDKEITLEKTINGRQPGKKQTDKETTLEKIINGRQPGKKNRQTRRQPWKN
jgi:hypothetical protein